MHPTSGLTSLANDFFLKNYTILKVIYFTFLSFYLTFTHTAASSINVILPLYTVKIVIELHTAATVFGIPSPSLSLSTHIINRIRFQSNIYSVTHYQAHKHSVQFNVFNSWERNATVCVVNAQT